MPESNSRVSYNY